MVSRYLWTLLVLPGSRPTFLVVRCASCFFFGGVLFTRNGHWFRMLRSLPQGLRLQMVLRSSTAFSGLLLLLSVLSGRPVQADQARASFHWYAFNPPPPGTVVVQDKVRGLIWLLNLR